MPAGPTVEPIVTLVVPKVTAPALLVMSMPLPVAPDTVTAPKVADAVLATLATARPVAVAP
ncbi:MAG: hypothetical protein E5Y29_27890, partial [Mesorhizobium sp.]